MFSIAQGASAEYYLESQRSFRHPSEYYTAGKERDGEWFNPAGLFGLKDGGAIDSKHFLRLYNGFGPEDRARLTRNSGSEQRSPGVDMTFSVDKSVSVLWVCAEPEIREEIERIAIEAARKALMATVVEHCSVTRLRVGGERVIAPADIMGATFLHRTSREHDPQLHVHCMLLNIARTHEDGRFRALHQYPFYRWKKAAGAMGRAILAHDLRQQLGIPMERYGKNGEFSRVAGVPGDVVRRLSKRRNAIVAAAEELGTPLGDAARMAGIVTMTRSGKDYGGDTAGDCRRIRDEIRDIVDPERLAADCLGNHIQVTDEQIGDLTQRHEALPEALAREQAVFRFPDIVEETANASAGLLDAAALETAVERVRRLTAIVLLDRRKPTPEAKAGMAHTELYSTRHTLEMERAVQDIAGRLAAADGGGLPAQAIEAKIRALLAEGYPLDGEQIAAIRHATARGARVSIIEGAAGSGKTTTLRPIADLYREHGCAIIPTAVAWRTAVALGDDLAARPFAVAKLLNLAAKGRIEIGENTVIVVDEAGMLATRQAHHLLRLAERCGARIVFAGDTQQQQPVEAGPGLRLVRDVTGSVRVDTIRRQQADLEDILVHVHGETPQTARFQDGLTPPAERERVLAAYDALEDKPVFTPWQAAASAALRDGDAGAAIEAYRARGRFHIEHSEAAALDRLVADWSAYKETNPGKSTLVLARTNAERHALSYLMRESNLAGRPDAGSDAEPGAGRTVIEVSLDPADGRKTSPLEIARGDLLRIRATHWEKQLFNGTVITVDDFEVRDNGQDEAPSVLIRGHTEHGRSVVFHHDEIRDRLGNIRIDYGYALTITSAQGMTVDRAFLLADGKPARETVYPAATRHREGLDIYVDRRPIAAEIAVLNPDDLTRAPVTDADIRAHLAERWSRSDPKEAALDYVNSGERERLRGAVQEPSGKETEAARVSGGGNDVAERTAAANDNPTARIGEIMRQRMLGWRHGGAVDAVAAGRTEVLESYGRLRARLPSEGAAVALDPAYAETLERHRELLQTAAPFRARPSTFNRLLAERGGLGRKDLDAFAAQYARAHEFRRRAAISAARRQDGESEARRQEPAAAVTVADAGAVLDPDTATPRQSSYPTAAALSAALALRAEDVCRRYLPDGVKKGNDWLAGEVQGNAPGGATGDTVHSTPGETGGPRHVHLRVHLDGPSRGMWGDAAGGAGDLLDLVRAAGGHAAIADAMDEAARFLDRLPAVSLAPVPAETGSTAEQIPLPEAADTRRLIRFLDSGIDVVPGNAAGRYLAGRGLDPADPAISAEGLRYHPGAYATAAGGGTRQVPALLAPVTAPDGALRAVHRIFLDGGGAQTAAGQPEHGDGAVRFANPAPARIAVTASVEDALSVLQVLTPRERAEIGVIACLDAGRAGAAALPNTVREIVLIQDDNAAGDAAWAALQDRYGNGDVVLARVAAAGKDANDDLNTLGAEAFRDTLAPLIDGPHRQETVKTPQAAETNETASEAEIPQKAAAVTETVGQASTKDIYNRLADDWNAHLKNAEAVGEPHYRTDGYLGLIERARQLSDRPELSENTRRRLARVLDAHEKQMAEQAAFAEDDDLNTLDAQTSRETLSPSIEGPRRQETAETVPAASEVETPMAPAVVETAADPGPAAGEASAKELCRQLSADWNAHREKAEAAGKSQYYTDGYRSLIVRAYELSTHPGLPENVHRSLVTLIDAHKKKFTGERAFAEEMLRQRDQPRIKEIWEEKGRLRDQLDKAANDKEYAEIRRRMRVLEKEYASLKESREQQLQRLGHSISRGRSMSL